ncbi:MULTISPECIES: maltotransferase domain-containing protein [Paraburkholderia]|uniref:maltotransferase domain-containing protein n=1 Tax=Paraburkholderia TaxID=1822464 RepID=UPI00224EA529|nr:MULTISPECIES: maltotransferase domain-containing protein [Paraburkholderia]MCX4164060.1 DUF3416 domain-containing protein [Paraburkholderia megapolitana]MDN7159555.1 DUF3416 domain-containing protein [Paraburkholderia sp. CHISQ3]MDQ6496602.1 DUF3416 domain-containing protein [Paraburkholderia megapolitana]
MEAAHAYAPRIYFVHAPLIGPLAAWPAQFAHAAALGFDHLLIGGLFQPGRSGHAFVTADHARLHPVFATERPAAEVLRTLAAEARAHGLTLLADLAVDRVAVDSALYAAHPDWFQPLDSEAARLDPRHAHRDDSVALFDFTRDFTRNDLNEAPLIDWWTQTLLALADAGLGGFRFDSPHRVPRAVWQRLRAAVRARYPALRFLAATPGLTRTDLAALEGAGFDSVFSSVRWWDFRAAWMTDEHAALVPLGGPIAFPEAPYDTRLAAEFAGRDDVALVERAYRRALNVAIATGTGWLMPMGFEYGIDEPLSLTAPASPGHAAQYVTHARFDLCKTIATVNALQRDTWPLNASGELRVLSGPGAPVAALLRGDTRDLRSASDAVLVIVNPDLTTSVHVEPARFLDGVPGNFTRFQSIDTPARHAPLPLGAFTLAPGTCRLFAAIAEAPVQIAPAVDTGRGKDSGKKTVNDALTAPRVVIESVSPAVDGGRFPVKRVVGERVEIRAAIFAEGHDKIAAAVHWRAGGETGWYVEPMTVAPPAGMDMWHAHIPLERLGRHEFRVVAWRDDFASLVDHVQKKLNVGQPVDLELDEAKQLFERVLAYRETLLTASFRGPATAQYAPFVAQFAQADTARRLEILFAPETARLIATSGYQPFLSHDPVVYPLDAERTAARFASWYEIFPRSMSDDEQRHGTFADVIAKLPRIRDMGFDVLYFPPIHPIGMANRKGRNNTLTAQPGDVGSPYAIGGAEGGHTAVHQELGTLADFHALLGAAREHGLEIALDFAIQCSPDHPWLKEHPTWFAWRPDGTLRYAENPPKKYQDIVNPDFYADDAKPDLWLALRDVILFWIEAGVRIFRVDNPHTKPLPFWEWMIADVRGRYPDTIFLAEAFTRPRMMYRLAKLGFSQSYTYFTWRESKRDFVEYLSELTQTEPRDFYRPNFFVNTPDINPRHLQSSGRAGFQIRAALAATLSGLWGVYSGFELCEAAALPNSEEYLDSEKYQLRAWDWNRPGNIVADITALNRIRRANPALHSHLGVTFLPAHNDHILFFEKATEARDNVLVVAINLDPFNEQGADIELSQTTFERWHLHDHAALEVTDEISGARFEWHGRWQHVRLDPGARPFAIWRIAPAGGLPPAEPDDSGAPNRPHAADFDSPNEGAQ